jgi:hypothetical protein
MAAVLRDELGLENAQQFLRDLIASLENVAIRPVKASMVSADLGAIPSSYPDDLRLSKVNRTGRQG